ncbi:MAG: helix-turn-helix transcriptional regulator [Steroidobacteraceae bacterium]
MIDKPELLDEHDAAAYVGMSTAFLRCGRMHGKLGNRTPSPPFLKLGRAVRYDRRDLDAWLAERRFIASGVRELQNSDGDIPPEYSAED